ncbi:MAG: hypothetical protein ACP5JU_00060 [Minisyncoccia bacterium]
MVLRLEDISKIYRTERKFYSLFLIIILILFFSFLFLVLKQPVFNLKNFILSFFIFILFLNLSLVSFLNFNFVQILILLLLESSILYSFIYKLNLNFIISSLVSFLILNSIAIIYLIEDYKNSLRIKWTNYFRTIWNFYSLIILLILFSYIVFVFNISGLEKEKIENIVSFIGKASAFFTKEDYLNNKLSDIILKNLNSNLDEEGKKLAIKLYINELNKKFSLNLNEDSTLKTAISEYLYNQTQLLKNDKKKEMATKIIFGVFVFLTAQSILYFLGIFISILSYLIYLIFLKIKIIKIEKETKEKELIKI